jgi:hypothetical protein
MSDQDEKLTPGLHLLPAPCFTITIVGSDDGPDFEGGFTHYPSEAAAAEAVREMQESWDDDDTRVLQIQQEEGFRCLTAVALCGTLFVYEGDATQSHFVDKQNLADSMDAYAGENGGVYWQVTETGAVLCGDNACRTCWPESSADPLTIPVAPVPGQLALDGSRA